MTDETVPDSDSVVTVAKMDLRAAFNALDALEKIYRSRSDFIAAAAAVTNKHHGPQGVSSDVRFSQAALALFDRHVEDLVLRHLREMDSALASENK